MKVQLTVDLVDQEMCSSFAEMYWGIVAQVRLGGTQGVFLSCSLRCQAVFKI